VRRHVEDGFDALFLGALNKAAGVDDDDVSLRGVGRRFIDCVHQNAGHGFRVHLILAQPREISANVFFILRCHILAFFFLCGLLGNYILHLPVSARKFIPCI
jgi:hypothetical protein